jgi:hypothetical protein
MMTAWGAATTEIDQADATFKLAGGTTKTTCVGEDSSTPYTQYQGKLKGQEVDFSPAVPTDGATGGLDHGLTGTLTWSGVKLTFNNLTGRGVATGVLSLTAGTPAVQVYRGALTLILQTSSSTSVLGRGWLSASTYGVNSAGALVVDGHILANVEVQISTPLTAPSITGQFGDSTWPLAGPGPIAPYSVETGLLHTC